MPLGGGCYHFWQMVRGAGAKLLSSMVTVELIAVIYVSLVLCGADGGGVYCQQLGLTGPKWFLMTELKEAATAMSGFCLQRNAWSDGWVRNLSWSGNTGISAIWALPSNWDVKLQEHPWLHSAQPLMCPIIPAAYSPDKVMIWLFKTLIYSK